MDDNVETFEIPAEMVDEMKITVQVLRARLSQKLGKDVEIEVIEADSQGFGGIEIGTVLLSIPVAGLAILSKKWVEEVLWPEIKPALKEPTKRMLDFLLMLVKSKPGDAQDA
jgi:hypothetical protein